MTAGQIKRERARELLIFYLRRVWEKAGLKWEADNSFEIRELVDAIVQAAVEP